jgi:hypothetical protein
VTEYSYNGWPASPDRAAIGVVASDVFPGGAKAGDVTTVLGYVATQFHQRVEPVIQGHGWGWTYKANVNNPSQLSCHASGTALDINAPAHSNGTPAEASFTEAQITAIYQILDEVQGSVSWLSGYDPMHFEICVSPTTLAVVAASLGGAAPAPTPPADGGFLMSLSDAQQDELFNNVKWLRDQLAAGTAQGQKTVGSTIAATLGTAQGLQNAVGKLAGDLSSLLFGPGVGKGQKTVGGTIAATLSQVQANSNELG